MSSYQDYQNYIRGSNAFLPAKDRALFKTLEETLSVLGADADDTAVLSAAWPDFVNGGEYAVSFDPAEYWGKNAGPALAEVRAHARESEDDEEGDRGHDSTLTTKSGKKVIKPTIDDADTLDREDLKPVEWIVEGMIPTGLSILGAPPKSFKSYMMLHLCACVASGTPFLGHQTRRHAVLYLDLESTKRRPQARLRQILGEKAKPKDLYISTSQSGWAKVGEGFEEQLSEIVQEHPAIKLVVVDVLSYIRPAGNFRAKEYDRDYATMKPLKALADRLDIAIVLVTHTTKMQHPDDDFNSITGSIGVTAAMDTQMVICKKRGKDDARLKVTGRDAEFLDLSVRFNQKTMQWEYLGTPEEREAQRLQEEYDRSDTVRAILSVLHDQEAWSGSIEELIIDAGLPTSQDPRSIGKQISTFEGLLWSRDRITHTQGRQAGTGRRIHTFQRL